MTQSPYFAAVDLGSNSFHMLIGRIDEGQLEIVDREKEMVQIARGLDEQGNLDDEARQRALDCLDRFAERLRDIPREQVRAVGTKTLRSAKQSVKFLRKAEAKLGHPIQIVSGYEEARLVYSGLSHSVNNDNKQRLVVDIGGGSTEFIIGRKHEPKALESLSLGCVSFTNEFFKNGSSFKKSMKHTYAAACDELESIRTHYMKKGWEIAYGTSGTIKAIGQLLNEKSLVIEKDDLHKLAKRVQENEGIEDKELSKLRRDVLPAGIAILCAIFDELELDRMHVSTASLKEGLIFDTLGRFGSDDAREITVNKLMQRYAVDENQANRVKKLAMVLWQSIQDQVPHMLGISRTKALKWAALLHEIGLSVSHSSHHNHGHYLIQHSDLAGFGRYEQFVVATLLQMHRKKIKDEPLDHISEDARFSFCSLLLCLRLAVQFSRRRENLKVLPQLAFENNEFLLYIDEHWLNDNPLTFASISKEQSLLKNIDIKLKIIEHKHD